MFDQEPPDAPKVPSTAGVQQRDPDRLKDELEQLLRAYVARQNKLLRAYVARQNKLLRAYVARRNQDAIRDVCGTHPPD